MRRGSSIILCLMLFAFSKAALAGAPIFMPYPSAGSTIINPYGPGDETALLLGALHPHYLLHTGHGFEVAHMPGRGGATAWGNLASQTGDGYTLAATNLESLILRSLASRPVFTAADFYHACILASAPLVLWVPETSPFAGLNDLVRSIRAYPHQLVIAGAGSGTITHLATLRLNFFIGAPTLYLPYMGTTSAMQAALAGQVHAVWGYPLAGFGRQMRMRPLAVAAPERLPHLPGVPTFDEAGIGLMEINYFGLVIPSEASPNTRRQVGAIYHAVAARPDFQNALRALGFTPNPMSGQELSRFMEEETSRFTELLQDFPLE